MDDNTVHPDKDRGESRDNTGYTAPDEPQPAPAVDEAQSDTMSDVPLPDNTPEDDVPPPEYNSLMDKPADDKDEDFTTVPLDGEY